MVSSVSRAEIGTPGAGEGTVANIVGFRTGANVVIFV
jgi:hypothetical protein